MAKTRDDYKYNIIRKNASHYHIVKALFGLKTKYQGKVLVRDNRFYMTDGNHIMFAAKDILIDRPKGVYQLIEVPEGYCIDVPPLKQNLSMIEERIEDIIGNANGIELIDYNCSNVPFRHAAGHLMAETIRRLDNRFFIDTPFFTNEIAVIVTKIGIYSEVIKEGFSDHYRGLVVFELVNEDKLIIMANKM